MYTTDASGAGIEWTHSHEKTPKIYTTFTYEKEVAAENWVNNDLHSRLDAEVTTALAKADNKYKSGDKYVKFIIFDNGAKKMFTTIFVASSGDSTVIVKETNELKATINVADVSIGGDSTAPTAPLVGILKFHPMDYGMPAYLVKLKI